MIKLIICMGTVLLSAIRRNSKILFCILFALMFLMAAGNVNSPDKDAYRQYYQTLQTPNFHEDVEIGFQVLVFIAHSLHFSFETFIAFYVFLCFVLLWFFLRKISDNKAMVLSLYMLFPFILDADQLRSFLAQLIVLTALAYLLEQKKPQIVRYAIMVLIAALFQQSCAIFLIYAFAKLDERKVLKYSIIFAAVFLFGAYLIPAIASHFSMFNLNRITGYFSSKEGKSTWFIYALFYLAVICITLYFTTMGKRNRYRIDVEQILYRYQHLSFGNLDIDMIEKLNIISIVLIALIPINPHFERLLRPILMLDYIALTNQIGKRIRYRQELAIELVLYFLCLGRFATYLLGGGWESYIEPLFFHGSII